PTIMVRDIAIQRRENDLILGTFGRGIYVIDDYTVVRTLKPETFNQPIALLPVPDAVAVARRGGSGKGSQGEALYAAPNPPAGATITWSLKEAMFTSLKEKRLQAQRDAEKANKPIRYPTPAELVAEADEEPVTLAASIADDRGVVWRLMTLPASRGMHTITWDLRGSPDTPADAAGGGCSGCELVAPGNYTVTIGKRERGVFSPLTPAVRFAVKPDPEIPLSVAELQAGSAYRQKQGRLARQVNQAVDAAVAAKTKIDAIIKVLAQMPSAPKELHDQSRSINERLTAFLRVVRGDEVNSARGEQVAVSIQSHVRGASPSGPLGPTKTNLEQYDIAAAAFAPEMEKLRPILLTEIPALDRALEKIGAPATPGRIPDIQP
ncbi:MAG: hypothetical protein ABUL71_00400, partial [Gemmatimonadota bacterium]